MQRGPSLETVRNLRDLGGVPAGDGRRVAAGRLFRSGSLHEASPADRAALEAMGVRITIDLRSAFEQARQPYEWPSGRRIAAPLAHDEAVAAIFARFQAGGLTERDVEDWWRLTGVFRLPEEHVSSMRTIFTTLLEAGSSEGVLFHCTGGKDRTGVVAAFLLEALGATRQTILEDFLLTNVGAAARAAEFVEWMRRATGQAMSPGTAYWLAGVKAEWLETLLDQTAARYGSIAGYLRERLGFGAQEVAALRAMYLEPPGA
jgi:protein-tyrosine phosphatase